MSPKFKRREMDKIRFSIGAKLITIISFIVILSLGSITALVSWMVRNDLQTAAETTNFETNHRSAVEAEITLINIRSNSRILIQAITAQRASVQESVNFFFAENPHAAAVFYIESGRSEQLLVNHNFLSSQNIDEGMVELFFHDQRDALARTVRGETLLKNGAPHFSKPLLALFFPWQNNGVGAVLFSSENLNNNFGYGVNQSYMINTDGDVLAHADFTFVKDGTNIKDYEFVRSILGSSDQRKQQLMETDFGFMELSVYSINKGIINWLWVRVEALVQLAIDKVSDVFSLNAYKKDGTVRQFVAYTKLNTAGVVVITSIEYNKVFEGIEATTRRNIYLTIGILCISIVFVIIFSKTISVPLRSLAAAARYIEGGIFDIDLKSKARDEIGVLTKSFQKMCSALNVFGRFTNKDIAVKAMRGEIKPGGLPKHGTVFFSDIRDFTAKSENFTKTFGEDASDKIVHWLNSYFTQMVDCVEKTNGVVDKFIGDAVMAHWGTAFSAGSPRIDAFNCVKAALMMRKSLYYLNKARKPGDPASPIIRIGCGINSGIVTAGQLGSDMRMEYTVIGDPVNLASRIEALTKPLGVDILISEDTWNLIGDKFVTEEMPSVTVKGKEKPVRIFAVINFYGEPKGPQSLDEVRSLLGIEPPNLEIADLDSDEIKYKIGEG